MLLLGIATAAAASAALNAGVVLQALDAREAPADEGCGWRSYFTWFGVSAGWLAFS